MQRWVFDAIHRHGKPVTFVELRATLLKVTNAPAGAYLLPSPERSLRRALHSMVRDKTLISLGAGGRADPYRYSLNPIMLAMRDDDGALYRSWIAAMEADDGTPVM